MVSIKQATMAAREFARSVLEPDQFKTLRLEEVDSSLVDGKPVWLITLSVSAPDHVTVMLAGVGRDYKTFAVQKEDGEVLSMKIRELAGA